MSPTLAATIAGLVTAVLWGCGEWFQARGSRRVGAVETYTAVNLVGLVMVLAVWPFFEIKPASGEQLVTLFQGAALIAIAYLAFIRALAGGALGIIVPLGSIYPLVTLILSIIFLNQVFKSVEIAAMAGIMLGALLLAYEKNHKKMPAKEFHKDTVLALFSSLAWGVGFFVLTPVFGEVSWQMIFLVNTIVMLVLGFGLLLKKHGLAMARVTSNALKSKMMILAGLILNGGAFAFYIGGEYAGSIIITAVLASSAPLIAALMGALIEHERLGVLKRVGAVVTVAGIILLNSA